MTLIEQDFLKFLIELGYTKNSAYWYKSKLKKFAKDAGYGSLIELADDVFILLDQSVRGDRRFNDEKLTRVRKNKNILRLFNGFLFDIHYERKFIIPRSPSINYFGVLTTNQTHIPSVRPRTLIDIDEHTGQKTNKQWFGIAEVANALHIGKDVLTRWENFSEEKKLENCIPHRYKGEVVEGIDLSWNGNNIKKFNYSYYILEELNNFLEYQFDYGTGTKREQYLSDDDIRKNSKKV